MRWIEIAILFIVLWLVVCMPELNGVFDRIDEDVIISSLP